MPLAYYSRTASQEFWSEHWAGEDVRALVEIARRSPLTSIIERALPCGGRILEAGCGLAPYVILLQERGWRIAGVDWSVDALRRGKVAAPGAPLAAMDLTALGMRTAAVQAYVSLGVVEHEVAGPGAIVAEAARVLAPGGRLLLSVPYWNGIRRLCAPHLARTARRVRAAGGDFYQFAFSRREIRAFLKPHGFRVLSFHPYDPARMPKKALGRLRPGRWRDRGSRAAAGARTGAGASAITGRPAAARTDDRGAGAALRPVLKRLAYSGPSLRLFAHMILAVAVRT